MSKSLFTVLTFTKINTKRFFRDKLAIFFTIGFPLIFLFVFGSIFGGNDNVTFDVALVNQSESQIAREFTKNARESDVLKVDKEINTLEAAKEKMSQGQLTATIVLPEEFGATNQNGPPSGEAVVYHTQNNRDAAQTLTTVLEGQFEGISAQFVDVSVPFTVASEQINEQGISNFGYVFAGLLGFAIIGIGVFGPMNVFPELKKQGILRRLHTTPLTVGQYFLSTALAQAIIGTLAIAIMFAVAITVFDLEIRGNILEIIPFIVVSIIAILGIGLAIGGWASNERQAAPLGNIIVFPMLFLSGTFFPRYLMPEWLQQISFYLPLTPVIDGLRMLAIEGQHFVDIVPQLALLAAWLVVIYLVAFRVFRWE